MDAVAGFERVYSATGSDVGIYLRVRIANRGVAPVTINQWNLELRHAKDADDLGKAGYEQILSNGPRFVRLESALQPKIEQVGAAFEKIAINRRSFERRVAEIRGR